MKIEPDTITGIDEMNIKDLNLFPNPSSGIITLNHHFTGDVSKYVVSVFNVLGKQVWSENLTKSQNPTLDFSFLTSGSYLLTIENGEEKTARKFSITK
jgi:hypothetical protein